MAGLQIVSGPSIEPVSLLEAKEYMKVDDDNDDLEILAFIKAARIYVENYTGRFFITRTVRQFLDGYTPAMDSYWEGTRTTPIVKFSSYIELAAVPAVSVSSVKYYDDADNEGTWDTSNYYVDAASDLGKIVLRDGGTFPTDLRTVNGLEINYTAGYGTSASDVPDVIKSAIRQYMLYLYEHRGDFERYPAPSPPNVLKVLLDPYKVMRFGSHPYNKMFKTGIG